MLMALILAGCDSKTDHSAKQQAALPLMAHLLHIKEFPATALTIDPFRKITSKMTMQDVVQICGLPDGDNGSGFYVFEYKLSDGSKVAIGTGDLSRLSYVTHGNEQLIGNQPK